MGFSILGWLGMQGCAVVLTLVVLLRCQKHFTLTTLAVAGITMFAPLSDQQLKQLADASEMPAPVADKATAKAVRRRKPNKKKPEANKAAAAPAAAATAAATKKNESVTVSETVRQCLCLVCSTAFAAKAGPSLAVLRSSARASWRRWRTTSGSPPSLCPRCSPPSPPSPAACTAASTQTTRPTWPARRPATCYESFDFSSALDSRTHNRSRVFAALLLLGTLVAAVYSLAGFCFRLDRKGQELSLLLKIGVGCFIGVAAVLSAGGAAAVDSDVHGAVTPPTISLVFCRSVDLSRLLRRLMADRGSFRYRRWRSDCPTICSPSTTSLPTSGRCGTSQHGLSSKTMALVTSDCGAPRPRGIKWP